MEQTNQTLTKTDRESLQRRLAAGDERIKAQDRSDAAKLGELATGFTDSSGVVMTRRDLAEHKAGTDSKAEVSGGRLAA